MQDIVWALLIIPIGVGLSLGYTISRSSISKKAAWRNLLTLTAFLLIVCPFIFALLFLPEPWRNYGSIGFYAVISIALWISLATESRRKRRAGSLLWNLGRSSAYRVILIADVLFFISAILQTVVFINLAVNGSIKSYSNLEYYLHISQLIFYWSLAIYLFWAGLSGLELREKGIYSRLELIKWEQIASYQWEGVKGNSLTVWLKQRFPFFPTRSWPIPLSHKALVERIITQQMSRKSGSTKKFSK
jgi:hypothetical protein